MEIAILALVVVLVLWWIGAFKSIGKLIDMGNMEIDELSKDQFVNNIHRSKQRTIKSTDVEKATSNNNLIKQYMEDNT